MSTRFQLGMTVLFLSILTVNASAVQENLLRNPGFEAATPHTTYTRPRPSSSVPACTRECVSSAAKAISTALARIRAGLCALWCLFDVNSVARFSVVQTEVFSRPRRRHVRFDH